MPDSGCRAARPRALKDRPGESVSVPDGLSGGGSVRNQRQGTAAGTATAVRDGAGDLWLTAEMEGRVGTKN
jgi:hypothetical protein